MFTIFGLIESINCRCRTCNTSDILYIYIYIYMLVYVCEKYMGTQHIWQMIMSLDVHESSVNLISIVTEFRVLNGFGIIYRDVFPICSKIWGPLSDVFSIKNGSDVLTDFN